MPGETTPHPHAQTAHLSSFLFRHEPHQYQPRNVNEIHKAEQAASGFNNRLAVTITQAVGTMWTAYLFAVLAFVGLLAILQLLTPVIATLVAWTSQTFLQLVFLPIIMVGQNVLGHRQELQADEQFERTKSIYRDIEQIMQHLSAQDAERQRQESLLLLLLEKNGISRQQLEAKGLIINAVATPTVSLEHRQQDPQAGGSHQDS